jgi:hypothetical protein
VCCQKTVHRTYSRLFSIDDILNFIGCLYLQRHNFDLAAANAIDGSVFVISGRTCAYRASVVRDPELWEEFGNEKFWGTVGNLPEDDNFLTRWLVNRAWKIRFVMGPSVTMEATIGTEGFARFSSQIGRWTRSTWRSNTTSLLVDKAVWCKQPWGVYAIYLTSWFNFAAPIDFGLMMLSWYTAKTAGSETVQPETAVKGMALLIMFSKLAKTYPHYQRNPRDAIFYIPVAIAFGYVHSLVKLYCLCTIRNTSWGPRPGMGLARKVDHPEKAPQREAPASGIPGVLAILIALSISVCLAILVGQQFNSVLAAK